MPILECGFLLLLLGAWLLPDVASRRASALAAIAAGLATAGLRAGATPLPPGFLAVDGALFVLAVILAFGSTLLAGRPHAPSAVIGAGALLAGAIGLGWGAREIVAAAPKGPLLLALVALTATVAPSGCSASSRSTRTTRSVGGDGWRSSTPPGYGVLAP